MRLSILLVATVFAVSSFAGCFGGGSGDNKPPVANFTVTPQPDGITFLFDATNSSDPNGDALTVAWNFGDEGPIESGTLSEYGLVEYEYAVTNVLFHVSLVVRDDSGLASSFSQNVLIGTGNNTKPEIVLRNATRWVTPGTGVVLDASKSIDADQDFFSYEWTLGNFSEENNTVASEYLSPGKTFEHTFTTPGVYDFHCHPHPWMKSRVIVSDEDPNATSGGDVSIGNYTYEPKVLVVSPGSMVKWTNVDPDQHTVTTEMFAPGKVVHTGPVFSARLDTEGKYQARLTLNDGKGGITHSTWGLRASTDAPASPELRTLVKKSITHIDGTTPAGATIYTESILYKSNWTANLTATVTWADTSGQNANSGIRIELVRDNKVVTGCIKEATSCTLQYNVEPGNYQVRATGYGYLPNTEIEITTSAIQWTFPSFGDSAGRCPPGWDLHGDMCMKH
jgi:plastocyanin